jgi:hypothetical protein
MTLSTKSERKAVAKLKLPPPTSRKAIASEWVTLANGTDEVPTPAAASLTFPHNII